MTDASRVVIVAVIVYGITVAATLFFFTDAAQQYKNWRRVAVPLISLGYLFVLNEILVIICGADPATHQGGRTGMMLGAIISTLCFATMSATKKRLE